MDQPDRPPAPLDRGERERGERERASRLLRELVEECPRRRPCSEHEARAQERLAGELAGEGLAVEWQDFRFGTNLYALMTLELGLGVAGTLLLAACSLRVCAGIALGLHLLAALSLVGGATRSFHPLRLLLPRGDSRNLLARRPAAGAPRLRLVLLAHADAALTGWLFHPRLIRAASRRPPWPFGFLGRSLLVVVLGLAALALVDGAVLLLGPRPPLLAAAALLTLPALIGFTLNAQVVLRDEVVPGANDDLSGCVALPLLARRLLPALPDGVELILCVTGCEEAGLGGAEALARARREEWSRAETVVLALDGLSGGDLRIFLEGEVLSLPPPAWLLEAVSAVVAASPRFAEVTPCPIPAGGTDRIAFAVRGYDGLGLGCVDPAIGAPRHYHQPTDTPANLDLDKLLFCVDFVEALADELIRRRAG